MDDASVARELATILAEPTHRTSAGWSYLTRPAWARLRDWVPHVLGEGHRVWRALDRAVTPGTEDAARVVRQVVRTAAVTAPSDLWLLRHVVGALARTGWLARLEAGVEAVPPALEPDVTLLLARGYLVRYGPGWRAAEDRTARRVFHEVGPLPAGRPADLARRWADALGGEDRDHALLREVVGGVPAPAPHPPPAWVATPEDLGVGYRLVPLVLGLRAAGRVQGWLAGDLDLAPLPPDLAEGATAVLAAAGWVEGGALTPLGLRGLEKGPGPFGIVEAYWPYLERLPAIWAGEAVAHVARAANVAASQDANRATFLRANDALDRFCADTGFRYTVFVEHAVGRGEAVRQRYERAGDALVYVGADLEAAAIAGAREEQAAGRLPSSMVFVQADIADPGALVRALRAHGLDPEGAVMLVGNGLHEVRDRSDAKMVEVFRGYEQAGIVLLFTEEAALSVDDLLRTAWNTYHAGFRYVHERSGQGLRPASPGPPPGLGPPLPASWTECATRAGYVRADRYCTRSRRVHPYPPANGHNPSISANEFFVPARIARRLLPDRAA